MPYRSIVWFILLFCLCGPAPAQANGRYFSFSPPVADAYQKAIRLRLLEARQGIDRLKKEEPDNLLPLLIDNYVDFLTVFAGERPDDYKRLLKNMEPRLDKIARGDRHSPYYLYCQAEIRLQWAFLSSRFGNFLSAMSDTKQAYALLKENQRRHPDFTPNLKSLGIIHALVGNVPEEFHWALKLLGGMSGTTEQGLQELAAVRKDTRGPALFCKEEALMAESFLLAYLNNEPAKAWHLLSNSAFQPDTNPLAACGMALMAMRAGQNDAAIRLLDQAPTDPAYTPFHQRDYLLGLARLRRLDPTAGAALEQFTNRFAGENGLKEGHQKLAWFHLIFDRPDAYRAGMQLVKKRGAARSEADKAALEEANTGIPPDKRLLQARLLFDGGYYQRAYDLLKSTAADAYQDNPKNQLEYIYRLGRIAHRLGKPQEALQYYRQTIEIGAASPWYFACNAALHTGLLYEEKKNYRESENAYLRCLRLKPETYAAGLHAQAKSGLARIKGR